METLGTSRANASIFLLKSISNIFKCKVALIWAQKSKEITLRFGLKSLMMTGCNITQCITYFAQWILGGNSNSLSFGWDKTCFLGWEDVTIQTTSDALREMTELNRISIVKFNTIFRWSETQAVYSCEKYALVMFFVDCICIR